MGELERAQAQAWATEAAEVPLQHIAYHCNVDSDRRRIVEYRAWLPLVMHRFHTTHDHAALADLTLKLLGFAEPTIYPTPDGLETLIRKFEAAKDLRVKRTARNELCLLIKQLMRMRHKDLVAHVQAQNNTRAMETLLRRAGLSSGDLPAVLANAFGTPDNMNCEIPDLDLGGLPAAHFAWTGEAADRDGDTAPATESQTQKTVARFGDTDPSIDSQAHKKLIALAAAALRSGDDTELYRFLELPSPPEAQRLAGKWPEALSPEHVLSNLTLSFFAGRSLPHCGAGVLACMAHVRASRVINSEDLAIYVMDTWKTVADSAMAKWRPYLTNDGTDGEAAVRAMLAHEIFLAPRLQGLDVVGRKVRYEAALPRLEAMTIEDHASNRLLIAWKCWLSGGGTDDVGKRWARQAQDQLQKLQMYRSRLLSSLDVGSKSLPRVSTRLIEAKCNQMPATFGLTPEEYFRYATMRYTDLLSLLTLYVEHDKTSVRKLDSMPRFWGGLRDWEARFSRMTLEATGSKAIARGSLGGCTVEYTCKKCGLSAHTRHRDRQTHAADEPHTYDIYCAGCGHSSAPD